MSCYHELCHLNGFMLTIHYRNTDDAKVHFNRALFAWWLVAIEGGVFFAAVFLTVFVYNLLTVATVSFYYSMCVHVYLWALNMSLKMISSSGTLDLAQ